ncbi:MAG TPA: Stk1 family PASTA domain-containing Ser/Thr kinase, partial [Rubrobacteraceae bacterium]|nr:Stk1 family PASTA domain-containing Ser/Thr kinase [Rubrobacteraceae bacterium]
MHRDLTQLVDNRYRIVRPLGSGGMAEVYLAHDDVLDRDVALKVMSGRYADDDEFVERFRREAQSAAALSHPNIVSIFDRGEDENGTYYIAMEYLPGGTLKDRILKRGALPPKTAAAVTLQIAEALSVAHRAGVVHRDIKPHNVLITASGDVKVADFGIARAATSSTMTRTGSILGTAHYISPEQAMGEPVGPQSDLYSLGIVLYEMLTGELPYDAETPIGIAMKHVNGPLLPPRAVNPDVPRGINSITCRLLSKQPGERYDDADELVEDLERVMNGLDPTGGTTRIMQHRATTGRNSSTAQMTILPPPPQGGDHRRRKRGWVAPVLLLVLLLALIGGLAAYALFGGAPARAEVPDLQAAASLEEAQEIAARAPGDFAVVEGERVGSKEPVGEIVRQSPAPGEVVEEGSDLRVDLSGRQIADLPNVEGETEEDATSTLEEAGFEVGVKTAESEPQEEGDVVGQDPAGGEGETAEVDSTVTITVGAGPDTVPVPELAGITVGRASAILDDAGLRLGDQTKAASDTVPKGQIVSQQPVAGTEVRPDSEVGVTVSTGPELSTVPDVVGLSADDAEAELWNALFAARRVTVDSDQPEGTVVSTNPAAGTEADWTAKIVTINVSEGPPSEPALSEGPPPEPALLPVPQPTPNANNGGGNNQNDGAANNGNGGDNNNDNGGGNGGGGPLQR